MVLLCCCCCCRRRRRLCCCRRKLQPMEHEVLLDGAKKLHISGSSWTQNGPRKGPKRINFDPQEVPRPALTAARISHVARRSRVPPPKGTRQDAKKGARNRPNEVSRGSECTQNNISKIDVSFEDPKVVKRRSRRPFLRFRSIKNH